MPAVASVAIESPVPQLDRLFDYEIPAELAHSVSIGVRVLVPLGRSGKEVPGFVVDLPNKTDFPEKLSQISSVVSPVQILPKSIYQLARAVADRQAGSLHEVLRGAIPKRSVRVEEKWLASGTSVTPSQTSPVSISVQFKGECNSYAGKLALLAEPRLKSVELENPNRTVQASAWLWHFAVAAVASLKQGKSTILIVPDFRDLEQLLKLFRELNLDQFVANLSSDQTAAIRYSNFLRCLEATPCIAIGSRAAAYAPVADLGRIMVWDDLDQSLSEPTAPYVHTRDVVLIRQAQSGCDLLFASHSRSAEVQRLVELNYLAEAGEPFAPPRIIGSQSTARIDSTTYNMARSALEQGGSVLFQVSSTGHSQSMFCASCQTRSQCSLCHGPLFIDGSNIVRCRWCAGLNLGHKCHDCGASETRMGAAGSARTAQELGKSFPGTLVIESTHSKRILSLEPGKKLVVATPGCEPVVTGGYALVVLLDCGKLVSRDTLRATEYALQQWANASSLCAGNGQVIAVGMPESLSQPFSQWKFIKLASKELRNRRELGFTPAVRVASISGSSEVVGKLLTDLKLPPDIKASRFEVLGPYPLDHSTVRAIIRYDYALGSWLAGELRSQMLKTASGSTSKNASTGRVSRSVRVKMDDAELV